LVLAGCTAPSRVALQDEGVYARTLMFTVPLAAGPSRFASSFGPSDNQAVAEPDSDRLIKAILRSHRLTKVSQFPIGTLKVEAVVAEIRPKALLTEVIEALDADDRVQSVQSIRPYRLLSYNDPYYALQNTVNGDRIEHIHEITTGKNVVVGIIDTGVDRWHPELADRIVYTNNLVMADQASFDLDEHGTAVAGVIGSAANNDLGIVGVAPDVRLMVFKACQQEILSRRTSCDSVSIIRAINDALSQHPDILNLSLAGPRDPMIERLLRVAARRGIVIVAAVDEQRGRGASFPASMQEGIAVGTSLSLDEPTGDMVLAPGVDMLTTAPGSTYGFKSGSSMATAYVSGIAALMKEKVPSLTGEQVRLFLRDSSRLDENELPVVDMCTAVNHAANTAYRSCDRARRMAVQVHHTGEAAKSNVELAN
jgi:subtilisin family serine protease